MARQKKRPWRVTRTSRNVYEVRFDISGGSQWSQDVLLISDCHWDNKHCDRELLARHMQQAVDRDAPNISVGDYLCAMQGKWDPRQSRDALRPEHAKADDYLDSLVSTATEWLAPYGKHLAVIGQGNHETAIIKRHETDLIERLAYALRSQHGAITQSGGYANWFRMMFQRGKWSYSEVMYAHHGFGGGGEISQGKPDFAKLMLQVRADVYCAGHIHRKEAWPHSYAYLSQNGAVKQSVVHNIRLGTYKDEYIDSSGGYHIEKGRGPRPLGGYWLRYELGKQREVYRTAIEAI